MSKKTLGLIIGLILLTTILVWVAIQNTSPANKLTTDTTQTPVNAPSQAVNADATLFMTPVVTGNVARVTVAMSSEVSEVTAVQMEISYDPTSLSFVSVTPSDAFAQGVPLLNTIDRTNGRITYALGLSPQQESSKSGQVDVATIVFNKVGAASGSATTEVEFLPKSLISARGVSQSVLKETRGTIIQFNN